MFMPRIVESLPLRTRLPLEAWALAGLVTLCSIVSSITHTPSVTNGASPGIEHATEQDSAPNQARI
jgi:hypothetical protein